MCLVALFYRVVDDAPIVLGANREEAYARGGEPPRVHQGRTRFLAGTDPVAGGTWLGINQHGMIVAVTNRPRTARPAAPRSRGLLVRDLLGCDGVRGACDQAVRQLETGDFAGCNLLLLDPSRAVVIHAGDWLRVRYLPPGLHVLTNGDVNDGSDARLLHVGEWLTAQAPQSGSQAVQALEEVCGHHLPENPPVCVEGPDRGTVSSSIFLLRGDPTPDLTRSEYHHCQGPPTRAAYVDHSELLRQLL